MSERRGQGLVELLIAVAVLMVSAVATVTLIFATLSLAEASKSQVLAVNLAREGIEVVRTLRDGNWLMIDSGDTVRFDAGLSDVDDAGPPVSYDYTAVPSFDAMTSAWTLDFGPDENDFATRSDATAVFFDACRNPSAPPETCGVYTQGTEAAAPPSPPFQKIRYWRLITLNPICWDLGEVKPEDTEEVLPGDGAAACAGDGTVVGVQVRSRLQWEEKGRSHSLELVDKLFDWKV